jgi:hypothetical protein
MENELEIKLKWVRKRLEDAFSPDTKEFKIASESVDKLVRKGKVKDALKVGEAFVWIKNVPEVFYDVYDRVKEEKIEEASDVAWVYGRTKNLFPEKFNVVDKLVRREFGRVEDAVVIVHGYLSTRDNPEMFRVFDYLADKKMYFDAKYFRDALSFIKKFPQKYNIVYGLVKKEKILDALNTAYAYYRIMKAAPEKLGVVDRFVNKGKYNDAQTVAASYENIMKVPGKSNIIDNFINNGYIEKAWLASKIYAEIKDNPAKLVIADKLVKNLDNEYNKAIFRNLSEIDESILKENYRELFENHPNTIKLKKLLRKLGLNENWDNPEWSMEFKIKGEEVREVKPVGYLTMTKEAIRKFIDINPEGRFYERESGIRYNKSGDFIGAIKGKPHQFVKKFGSHIKDIFEEEADAEACKYALSELKNEYVQGEKARRFLEDVIRRIPKDKPIITGDVKAEVWKRDPFRDLSYEKEFHCCAFLGGSPAKYAEGYIKDKAISMLDFSTPKEGRCVRVIMGVAVDKEKRPIMLVDSVEDTDRLKPAYIKKVIEKYAKECGFAGVMYKVLLKIRGFLLG